MLDGLVWGENPQHEYGGPAAAAENNTLDRRWLEEFGGLLGLRVSDLVFAIWIGIVFNHQYLDQKIWKLSQDDTLNADLGLTRPVS